ncbi:hypothetical protein QBC47DRAFT_394656 [Echria macrotheca]|uniref:Uncharacterized protein n=1 Tax=Echria macrotheca TaxID=438768 RepID=A0AAJ0F0H4_9PEZI|nr:hypothetical protein QBC47DRAFT_394656 [Echria macrotheca]
MALLPDLGTWLLRSVWRDSLSSGPVAIVEKLSASRPLRHGDKDALLGAVLALGPSLQLALQMLLELLPEDESRERLGEVLCPTLGQLHRALSDVLTAFDRPGKDPPAPEKHGFLGPTLTTAPRPRTPHWPAKTASPPSGDRKRPSWSPAKPPSSPVSAPAPTSHLPHPDTTSLTVPSASPALLPVPEISVPWSPREHRTAFLSQFHHPASNTPDPSLMKELRAEMRVNAAIQVAVDALEFADGQLRIVRSHASPESSEMLGSHFYEGYNRILLRALELERREFDSPPYAASLVDGASYSQSHMGKGPEEEEASKMSITFGSPERLPVLPRDQGRDGGVNGGGGRGVPVRRNTTQGISEPDNSMRRTKLKRRLSLAEELALACDGDSDEEGSGSDDNDNNDDDDEDDDEDQESEDEPSKPSSGPNSRIRPKDTSSESESEDSEEAAGESESQSGESDSDDTSSEDGDRNVGRAPARHADAKDTGSARLKRLETRVAVISPPTSPERPAAVVMTEKA